MEKIYSLTLTDEEALSKVGLVLSNPLRVKILRLLSNKSMNVNEIAKALDTPLTTVSSSIKILEESGIVKCEFQTGKRGLIKLCSIVYESLNLNFMTAQKYKKLKTIEYNVKIGNYYSVDVDPTCGLADEKGFIGKDDDIASFYHEKRNNAQLIWFSKGFVEYRIPYEKHQDIFEISFSAEICSEAPYYRLDWPSDISLLINDVDIGCFTCPGDFGGRRGKYSPKWWPTQSTQFGLYKTFAVNKEGSYLDFQKISHVKISDVIKDNSKYISFKIGVKRDAKNSGGINIFGEKFGDYPSGITIKLTLENK